MKYLILLKIKIEEFPEYYIQVAKIIELSIHPNLTDEIETEEYFCTIERISYNISNNSGIIYLNAFDGLPYEQKESEVVTRLKNEIQNLKKFGWWLNDYHYGNYNL